MAAERAALVGEDGACRRFHGGYRNVDPSIVDSRRTRALRARMIAGANFPQQPAGLGVQRVNPRQHIDEVDRIPGCPLSLDCRYSRSRTRTRVGVEGPIDASCLGVERVKVAGIAAEEDPAGSDCGLRMHFLRIRNAEGPSQPQRCDLSSGQTCCARRLKTRVLDARTPAVPCGSSGRIGHRRIRSACIRHLFHVAGFIASHRPPREEFCNLTLLNIRKWRSFRRQSQDSQRRSGPARLHTGRHRNLARPVIAEPLT